MDRILISLFSAVGTCGILYFGWLLLCELIKHYGVLSILVVLAFIGVWSICYELLED